MLKGVGVVQLRVHLVQVLRFLYGLGDHDQLLDQGGGRKVFLFPDLEILNRVPGSLAS